jgi:hypothetical protein
MKRDKSKFAPAALALAAASVALVPGARAAGMHSGSGRSLPANPYGIPQIEVYQDPGAPSAAVSPEAPGMGSYRQPPGPDYSAPSSGPRGRSGFGSSRSSRPSGFGFGPDRGMGMGSQPGDMMGYPATGMMGQNPAMGYEPGGMMEPGGVREGAGEQVPMTGYPPAGFMEQRPMMGSPPGAMMAPAEQSEAMPERGPMMGYPPAGIMGQGPIGGYGAMPPMMQDPSRMMNEYYNALEQRMDRLEALLQDILDNQQRILSSQ